jgi:hypothetical protein
MILSVKQEKVNVMDEKYIIERADDGIFVSWDYVSELTENIERKLKYHVCAARALNMMDLVTDRNGRYVLDYLSFIRFSKYDFLRVRTVGRKTLEVIEELTETLKSIVGDSVSEEELQRRKEVVELAERIFFSDRGNMYTFKECVEISENSVNIRNQYLKDGKLC